ncbi:hypothetical protein ACFFIX_05875 [Metabacillus herbersteinensis]|uniref:Uncharacterized protein n=1 Tax=Metabacillus herbersteinensis TaxID=283816 RepID=A0ABV6GBC6_9BACI
MMKKGKLLIAGAALAVSIPTFAYASAEGGSQPSQLVTTVVAEENVHNNEGTWTEKRHKHQEKLLEIVKTYSPDTLIEWETVIAEREEIFSKVDKEELKGKKKQWKEEHGSKKESKGEWKEKRKTKHEKMRELKKAVKQEDTAKVQQLLSELLVNYKERNEAIKNRIAE